MKIEEGDLWDRLEHGYIVIPTNIGWKSDGCNVMGRGLAKEAADRFPGVALWYGAQCLRLGAQTHVMEYPHSRLILFPVKPLNEAQPWLSWRNKADLALIERSAWQLSEWPGNTPIYIPMVGCGNGRQDVKVVLPLLERHLSSERFILVL